MRTLLLTFALVAVLILSLAGFRGSITRRPPIEVFNDMVRQPRPRPQTSSEVFADSQASRLLPDGAIARGSAFEDIPLNTGRVSGTTNFVALNPLPITAEVLARGKQRYQITCLPCHGAQADGKGITPKYGLVVIGNLHDARIVRMTDGEIFNTVSYGKNLMQGYAASVAIRDRWAAIAYLRALQLGHLGTLEDVPEEHRAQLMK